MKNILRTWLLALFLAGCATGELGTTSTPLIPTAPSSAPTKVTVTIPPGLAAFTKWAGPEVDEICKELGVPSPKELIIKYELAPLFGDEVNGFFYIKGRYYPEYRTLVVWVRHPKGFDLGISSMALTLYHEILHHYDTMTDNKYWKDNGLEHCPDDHNAIFDKRIKERKWTERLKNIPILKKSKDRSVQSGK